MANILEMKEIYKTYTQGKEPLHILQNTGLALKKGETVSLVGPSGCGKTTLLQIAGLLDVPDQGSVVIDGVEFSKLKDKKLSQLRGQKVGFVFQFHPFVAYSIPTRSPYTRRLRPTSHLAPPGAQATRAWPG